MLTEPQSQPTAISATQAQAHFARVMREASINGTHFIVERASIPMVVILPLTDYKKLVEDDTQVTSASTAKASHS